MSGLVTLQAGAARATVALRGAEWQAWTIDGRDLLWRADPAFWADTAPVLFPVVGWTAGAAVRVGGRRYPLGLHGFARHHDFRLVDVTDDSLTLRLAESPATQALFPFRFAFDVHYRLTPDALDVALVVANTGDGPMPYACGLHPGFAWPFAGGAQAGYSVRFDAAEDSAVPVITNEGLFSAERRPLAFDGRTLPLTPDLFAREALCFLDARSGGLGFVAPDGAAIRMETTDFPHLALWSRPGAPFLAIEAWTGYGDPQGFDGDLFAKPSMRTLDPGAHARHEVSYRYRRAGKND